MTHNSKLQYAFSFSFLHYKDNKVLKIHGIERTQKLFKGCEIPTESRFIRPMDYEVVNLRPIGRKIEQKVKKAFECMKLSV
jgi:hypothetical protein